MKSIDFIFILIGHALKAFMVALFSLTIGCLLLTVFNASGLAEEIMVNSFPVFVKSALTLLASIAFSSLVKSLN